MELPLIISQLEIGISRLEEQVGKLRKAVRDGIYRDRSLVDDGVLMMEADLRRLREALEELKEEVKAK